MDPTDNPNIWNIPNVYVDDFDQMWSIQTEDVAPWSRGSLPYGLVDEEIMN